MERYIARINLELFPGVSYSAPIYVTFQLSVHSGQTHMLRVYII